MAQNIACDDGKLRVRRWQTSRAAIAISACCDGRLRTRRFQPWLSVLGLYPNADLGDAVHHFVCHDVADADGAFAAFLLAEGQSLSLVLMMVDTSGYGEAFGIGQGIAHSVASAEACLFVAAFHGQHDVLEVHMSRSPQPDDERAVEVRLRLRQAEADSVASVPSLPRQRLVAVQHRAVGTSCTQQANQGNEMYSRHDFNTLTLLDGE